MKFSNDNLQIFNISSFVNFNFELVVFINIKNLKKHFYFIF